MAFSMQTRVSGAMWVLVMVVGNASHALAQDSFVGQPIPNGPDAKTNGVYREGLYRYYLQLVTHYQEHTQDPESVQAIGGQLLTAAVQARCLMSSDNLDFDGLNRLGKAAIEAGSKDVLIRQRYARLRAFGGDIEMARTILLECDAELADSSYPAIVPLLNSLYLCSLARTTSDEELMQSQFPKFLEHFARWFQQESMVEENRRYVFDLAYSMTGDFTTVPRKEAILQAVREQRDVDAWVVNVFRGAVEHDIAFQLRGGGWASDVTSGGWQGFAEHLQIASECLHRAWETQPDYPEPASLMISVAMGGLASESPRIWFDRAVAAEMDYPDAYRRLMNAMLPRWGGSHRIMSRFGVECVATKRFDTLVPLHLFSQILTIEDETGRTDRYWKTPKVYAKLREMFEGYRQAPDLPELQELFVPRDRILSWYAAVAALAEQWQDARAAIDQIDGELDESAIKGVQVGRFEVTHALAVTGNVKELVLEAERLAVPNTAAALEQAIEKLAAALQRNDDARAASYLLARARMLREQRDFQRGEWTPLTFDEDLSGWRLVSGDWKWESDKAAIGTREPIPGAQYYLPFVMHREHKFQPPYLFSAEIEEIEGSASAGVGVTIGDVAFDGIRSGHGRFCIAQTNGAGVEGGNADPAAGQYQAPSSGTWPKRKYQMDVRVWPNSLLLFVNGEGPFATVTDSGFLPETRLGLGGRCLGVKSRVRFSNVRIRRLPYGPVATMTDYQELIGEANKMIECDPADWYARWVRGSSYFELADYEAALKDFGEFGRLRPTLPGAHYMIGRIHAKTKHYAAAIDEFKLAEQETPTDYRVLREWAELEMTADDPQYRDFESALKHALQAEQMIYDPETVWQYQLSVAEAHAKLGDYTNAVKKVSSIANVSDAVANQQIAAKQAEFRDLKGNSYRSAVASLFWEGDMTTRILGMVLAAVLSAANLIVIGKVAKNGRLAGVAAGVFGGAISLGVPCALAVLFGVGEGPAVIKLLTGVVGIAAIAGAIGGFVLASKKSPDSPQAPPITAELLDSD